MNKHFNKVSIVLKKNLRVIKQWRISNLVMKYSLFFKLATVKFSLVPKFKPVQLKLTHFPLHQPTPYKILDPPLYHPKKSLIKNMQKMQIV